MRDLLSKATALVVLSVLLGYAGNAARPDGVSFAAVDGEAACGSAAPGAPTYAEVPADAAVAELALGAVALDAREEPRFAAGHVEGAVHLPCAASSREVEPVLAAARAAGAVVVYGDDAEAQRLAAELATRLGWEARVVVARGGFDALEAAGAAAASGSCERCGRSM